LGARGRLAGAIWEQAGGGGGAPEVIKTREKRWWKKVRGYGCGGRQQVPWASSGIWPAVA
jgi:hypothetical protein